MSDTRTEQSALLVTYPVRAFMDMSTAHLSGSTHMWLAEQMRLPPEKRELGPAGEMPDGWFIWAAELPAQLAVRPSGLHALRPRPRMRIHPVRS